MSFEHIEKVLITSKIVIKTLKFLQQWGEKEKEAHALWIGKSGNNIFYIEDVWFPEQINNDHTFLIFGEELNKINRELYKRNLRLIAQIHTHRGVAFHSGIDNKFPVMTTLGGFSIVIPNYGFISGYNLHEYIIFRLTKTDWIELTQKEVDNIFTIINKDDKYV